MPFEAAGDIATACRSGRSGIFGAEISCQPDGASTVAFWTEIAPLSELELFVPPAWPTK